jgi:hypothetical protein
VRILHSNQKRAYPCAIHGRHYLKKKNETELFEVSRANLDIIIDRFPILKERLLAVGGAVRVRMERALQVSLLRACVHRTDTASFSRVCTLCLCFCSQRAHVSLRHSCQSLLPELNTLKIQIAEAEVTDPEDGLQETAVTVTGEDGDSLELLGWAHVDTCACARVTHALVGCETRYD